MPQKAITGPGPSVQKLLPGAVKSPGMAGLGKFVGKGGAAAPEGALQKLIALLKGKGGLGKGLAAGGIAGTIAALIAQIGVEWGADKYFAGQAYGTQEEPGPLAPTPEDYALPAMISELQKSRLAGLIRQNPEMLAALQAAAGPSPSEIDRGMMPGMTPGQAPL